MRRNVRESPAIPRESPPRAAQRGAGRHFLDVNTQRATRIRRVLSGAPQNETPTARARSRAVSRELFTL
ncbi:unnamed protein product [Arctogadus glacialis]